MKTLKEINDWLENQEWYDSFCDNKQNDPGYRAFFDTGLHEDERRARIVSNAFDWNHTPEGFGFWEKANREYLQWLTGGDFMAEASLMARFN